MRALLLHTENSAVGYYRIWQQAKYLPALGWEVWRQENQPRLRTIDEWEKIARGTDIMVTARADNPDIIALALGIRDLTGCKLVYEIDDNIYDIAKTSSAYQYWYPGSPFFEVAELFLNQVDAITVSTPNLAEVYSKFNPNIYVLRNCQDPADWNVTTTEQQTGITIGWTGGTTHYDDLYMIRGALKKVLRRYPQVNFKVFGMDASFLHRLPNTTVVPGAVHVTQYPQALADQGFDIGLAPVVKRPFNLGKSNIKWQEYSMLEIPTIASNVGEYKAIDQGTTGLLADNNEAAWVYALEKLIHDATLRESLGKAAKQKVLSDFNIEKNIGQWDAAYRSIIGASTTGSTKSE